MSELLFTRIWFNLIYEKADGDFLRLFIEGWRNIIGIVYLWGLNLLRRQINQTWFWTSALYNLGIRFPNLHYAMNSYSCVTSIHLHRGPFCICRIRCLQIIFIWVHTAQTLLWLMSVSSSSPGSPVGLMITFAVLKRQVLCVAVAPLALISLMTQGFALTSRVAV